MRQDLSVSRKLGDERGIASSLVNLAALYGDLRQLSTARKLLREAKIIAHSLLDENLTKAITGLEENINAIGRNAGTQGDPVGPNAWCACESGKQYQNCCGLADFEPEDLPSISLQVAEGAQNTRNELAAVGARPSTLDYILRVDQKVQDRHAFTQIHVHDGWISVDELPDVANVHFMSARSLAAEAQSEPDSMTKPVACVVMAVCGLEAFINQLAFWVMRPGAVSSLGTPVEQLDEFGSDSLTFQRTTSLMRKWHLIGSALIPQFWPPGAELLTKFEYLLDLRNEIVHFKSFEYEQVIPKPKSLHPLVRRAPPDVEVRNIPRSWPNRIFTPSLASWSITVANELVTYFKEGFKTSRLQARSSQPPS
jgi:hypothetical protein